MNRVLNTTDAASDVLSDPSASDWLKDALREALQRDPVDAAKEAEWLSDFLSARCDEEVPRTAYQAPAWATTDCEVVFRIGNARATFYPLEGGISVEVFVKLAGRHPQGEWILPCEGDDDLPEVRRAVALAQAFRDR
jgi:hypothetical protein